VNLYRQSDWGREVADQQERDDPWRTPIGRDYGRIIHCAGFRRLQGKTQVFPGHESDFFRNRLTHSLEVAQIAEGIAQRLNHVRPELKADPINERLCAAAGLVHDIGHPPFGHNGERALDDAMRRFGGFEGNAQTLRILSRLEKKARRAHPENGDDRAGLNLTYRLLAAILKYDRKIPQYRGPQAGLVKGYYYSEAPLVARIKRAVCGRKDIRKFKTLECSIMDVADDIAYSTYDLEDSLKAGFLTPASILASEPTLLQNVARKVSEQVRRRVTRDTILSTFADIFSGLTQQDADDPELMKLVRGYRSSQELSQSGYLRTKLSSQLVNEAINCVELDYDAKRPALSSVELSTEGRLRVEVLKQYTFEAMIYSARVKLAEYRGYEVVSSIFEAITSSKGDLLLPEDVREQLHSANNEIARMRVLCDFVAGMTDRYAAEFYARLHSDSAQSMFKPI
jgi:dGTPase